MTQWQGMIRDCPVAGCGKLAYPVKRNADGWTAQCRSGHVSHPK